MSNQSPFGGRGRGLFPTLPKGETIATYESYPEAQSAIDLLAKADFPVKRLSIVGSDLKTIERVTGKLSWGRVALAGAATGAWLGLFLGLLLVIFSPTTNFGFVIAALLIGAGFGMLFGVVSYALSRRKRDYTSVMQVLASSYAVIVDPDLANRARNVLENGPPVPDAQRSPEPQAPHPSDPPSPRHPSDPPPAWRPPERPGDLKPSDDGEDAPSDDEPDDEPRTEPEPRPRPKYGEHKPEE